MSDGESRHDPFPSYTSAERLADGTIHVLGVVAGCAGAAVILALVLPRASETTALSLVAYCAGLITMLTFSALYNMVRRPGLKGVLRRMDRSAIFVMIAGTYTPFAAIVIGGAWGTGLLLFVWSAAILGATIALTKPRRAEYLELALALIMGWSVVVAIPPLVEAVPPVVLALLLSGGVIYTLGVLFHVWNRLRFHNALWHACVLLAAACHYAAVFASMVPKQAT